MERSSDKKAVFLDRDGVIVEEPPYYAHRIDQIHFIEGAVGAIHEFNGRGFTVVVVSNQAGIARGIFRKEDAENFNKAMISRLGERGARIDAVYYCPHHPEAVVDEYRVSCDCRKPAPGMLLRAERELGIDLTSSFLIGDKRSDIGAGRAAGCITILVKTGLGEEEILKESEFEPHLVASNIREAAEAILNLKRARSIFRV